jgi:hypothetical protein
MNGRAIKARPKGSTITEERPSMLAPKNPPFNIVRASHVMLGVADLARSRAFYEQML